MTGVGVWGGVCVWGGRGLFRSKSGRVPKRGGARGVRGVEGTVRGCGLVLRAWTGSKGVRIA